jgi:uncharacterized phage protein (TIGR02220 family)
MSERKVKEESYVTIQAFMVNELHLSGNELITYAVIYGFSQDDNSWFVGSRSYLAAWCQTSEKSVTNNLKKLLDRGLLRKRTKTEHGCTFNDYQAIVPSSIGGKKVPSTGEESAPDTGEESSPHTLEDSHTSSEDASILFSEIIDYLNEKANRRYRPSTPKTREHIRARWSEGYRLDDFKHVIDVKVADWLGDDKMDRYLCPDTLFGTKFEKYLNQPMKKSGVVVDEELAAYGI